MASNELREIEKRAARWGVWWVRQGKDNRASSSTLARMAHEIAAAKIMGKKASEIEGKPYACLIHGVGNRPDDQHVAYDDTEERETHEAITSMPAHRARMQMVIFAEYTWSGTQQDKCRELSRKVGDFITYRQYKDLKRAGLDWLEAYFEGLKGRPKSSKNRHTA